MQGTGRKGGTCLANSKWQKAGGREFCILEKTQLGSKGVHVKDLETKMKCHDVPSLIGQGMEQNSYQRQRQESRWIQIETLVEDGIWLTAKSHKVEQKLQVTRFGLGMLSLKSMTSHRKGPWEVRRGKSELERQLGYHLPVTG